MTKKKGNKCSHIGKGDVRLLMTMQGENVLVTAYPLAGGVRTQVSLIKGEGACGDVEMLFDMARELRAAGMMISRGREILADGDGKEEGFGVLLRTVPQGGM